MVDLVLFLLVGLAAGWIAGQLTRDGSFGLAGNLIVGVLGSLLGGFLFPLIGISASGIIGSLIMATAGSVILLYLLAWGVKRF